MFWTNLKHSLDTNTTTHTQMHTDTHNYSAVVALGSIITEGQAVRGNRFRSCPSVDHQQRRRMKTFNQNNFVPALLAFNYILNTHTHTYLCGHTCVCVCVLAIVKSCWNVAANLSEWKSGQQTRAPLCCHSESQSQEGGRGQDEQLCTRTMHGPGSFAISVCHFQNVPAAASYHCPLRMTVLPMFRLLSFCFQMLNTAVCVCVCVCVSESVCVCNGACWSRQMFKFAALLPVCISSGQMSAPWQKRKGNGCRHWHTFIWTWAQVEQTQQ